ncbi:MAG TPA: enoyl-CoA hydratase/isomerase family protein [Acidimicrobiales bacterium]|nr:enoyl-CoA hydratase/isomerase family protein [Acidimicrobiales bacterium]
MLTLAAALEVLGGFRTGLHDAADVISSPLLAVDVTSPGDPAELEVPTGFPAVVVAVAGSSAPLLSSRGPDVALSAVAHPPAPWVRVADPEEALDQIWDRVASAPGAAVTLAEVLRAGRGRSVEEGLVLESLAYSMLQAGPEFARWRAGRPARPARPEAAPPVLTNRSGQTIEITLNRPEVHNAYNRAMRDELCQILAVAAADPECRVVLAGAGPSFCSGGDLDEFGTSPDPVSAHLVRSGRSPARFLAGLAGRTEAVVHGSCAGSGIELPAFAGTVRARPGTRMWLPEVAMGLIPGAGGTVSLARRIGPGRTAWMGLSGQPVDTDTALRWGLIDAVLPVPG